ncbi:MAG: response regulator transcription factor [Xanthobacteraceae bacterium]
MRRHQSFGTILIGKSVLMREGIARILRAENFRILASIACPDELTATVRAQQLLFLIVHTGDDFDLAVAQIAFVKEHYPHGRVAVVADHCGSIEPTRTFKAGATGYFVSAMSCNAFVKSIELVMMGETIFPPTFQSSTLISRNNHHPSPAPFPAREEKAPPGPAEDTAAPQLSPREMAILRCLIEGNSNKSIARKIDIAEATVKVHVKAILRKIRVQNRTQAAIWGMNNALLLQPANNNSLLVAADADKPLSNSIAIVSDIKRVGAP